MLLTTGHFGKVRLPALRRHGDTTTSQRKKKQVLGGEVSLTLELFDSSAREQRKSKVLQSESLQVCLLSHKWREKSIKSCHKQRWFSCFSRFLHELRGQASDAVMILLVGGAASMS